MTYFKVLSQQSVGEIEENYVKPLDSRCSGQDSKQIPPKYKTEALLAKQNLPTREDNIKIDLYGVGSECVDWIHVTEDRFH